MNTKKTLKNSIISVIGQLLTMLLTFINRRIFVIYLDIEYLGYQSVFGNIFSILSVAELGIGGIISFHLYKELSENNYSEIGKLMYLYKWIYRIIAVVIAVFGIGASFFVPYMVKDARCSIAYLYLVYYLQLASIVAGYFLSYRRTLYAADQKEYKCVEVDMVISIIIQTIQLIMLALFKNYIIYLGIQLSTTTIANFIILIRTNKEYPYLNRKYRINKTEIEDRNIISDTKNFLAHKLAGAVFGGTDNIVISAFCGIRNVALYGNYLVLRNSVINILFYRLLNPVQAAIGNIVYSNRSKEDLWNQFEMFDVFSFFFASYISAGFLIFFQPVIQIWMGSKEYLLPYSFVVVHSLTTYLMSVWEIVYKYRSVFGDYRQDRNCMFLSAVLNIVVSIALARPIGIVGVQIGTFFGFLPTAYGRIRFVVKNFFGQSLRKYFMKHLLLFCVVVIEGGVVYLLTKKLPLSILGLLLRGIIWVVFPLVINILVYFRNSHFKDMCIYLKHLVKMLGGIVNHAR